MRFIMLKRNLIRLNRFEVILVSLDKAIKYGKEHRTPYRGAKAIDKTCRNHGSCPWCERNRRYKRYKEIKKGDEEDANTAEV